MSLPKKIGLFILIIIMGAYVIGYINLKITANKIQNILLSTNNELTNQNVTINSFDLQSLAQGGIISSFTLNNPPDHISPYAFLAKKIYLNSGVLDNGEMVISSVIMQDVYINYDINSKNEINLYQIMQNIINNLKPSNVSNFAPIQVLNSANNDFPTLNYSGVNFYLGDILIQKPIVSVYQNRTLVKTINLDDIVLKFPNVKQPMNYGTAVLAGSVQVLTTINNKIAN